MMQLQEQVRLNINQHVNKYKSKLH
ncbi:hypothetical protein [Bacillus cereus group sp. BfR-BA-01393]|nr:MULTISPECIES: hypothetical protein [Bacillus cereus group]MEB9482880.1 hypothetical protein [Bacillus cereus]MEB9595771.1 hypothetical protein [Bacillus cereus]